MTANYAFCFFSFSLGLTFLCPENSPLAVGLTAFWLVFGGFLAFCLVGLILDDNKED